MNPQQTKPIKRPKRHCMVVQAYYPWAETRVQRQAEALIEHGYEVDVISARRPGDKPFEVVRGVNVYRIPVQTKVYSWPGFISRFGIYIAFMVVAGLKLVRLHLKRRYGVIQAHNLPDFLVFAALWPKLFGAKAILDIHDVMPEFFAEQTGRPMNSLLVRLVTWQEQISCRFADHVITVTELWRQSLIKRGVPPDKISVVMNLADHNLFHAGVQQRNGSGSNGVFTMVYHGTQADRHGLDTILQAMAKIRDEAPNLRLTLHGRGDFHRELKRMTHTLQLEDRVSFSTDFMPIKELPGFIASHNAGIVPYQNDVFTGGILPTKLLEYTALGLPSIAARTPAIQGYFDESMVRYFEPGNIDELAESILTLYRDKTLRNDLAAQAQQFNKQYNWPKESENYVKLIEAINEQ